MEIVKKVISESRLTLTQISKRSGLSEERVRELMAHGEPSLRELRALSKALRLPLSFFSPDLSPDQSRAEILFRGSMPESDAGYKSQQISLLSKKIGESISLARGGIRAPQWLIEFPNVEESGAGAERAASEFRFRFCNNDQYSPLLGLPKLLVDDLGILLFPVTAQKTDGASAVMDRLAFIFVVPSFKPRMLFTIAHELGHLLAHHRRREDFASLDKENEVASFRRQRPSKERFADSFAGSLLLPASGVGIALRKIRSLVGASSDEVGDVEILYLSRIFGVSFQAAAMRCEQLDLLPVGGALALYREVCKQHESPEKRADELGLPERPEIRIPRVPPALLEAAIDLVKRGEMSIGKAAASINLSVAEFVRSRAHSVQWI